MAPINSTLNNIKQYCATQNGIATLRAEYENSRKGNAS